MIKQRIVSLISLVVLSVTVDASDTSVAPKVMPSIPKTSQRIEGFVPTGWMLFEKTVYKDMNKDGKEDIALVILKEGTYSPDFDMNFNLLVLLGTESGFKLDYNIPSKLSEQLRPWDKDLGNDRFGISVTNAGELYVGVKRSYGHNTGSSEYNYTFAYDAGELMITNFSQESMWFDYSLISEREVQYRSSSYDFKKNTKRVLDSFNTFVPACSRDASEEEQKNCPEPKETIEPLKLPSNVKREITNFSRFSDDMFD